MAKRKSTFIDPNDTRFTPPAEESWWLISHDGVGVYSKAKTAYFAVQGARYPNGDCCGWVLSQCEVKLMPQCFEPKGVSHGE
jgi:hypothetical protein